MCIRDRNECSENTERAVIIEKNPEALLQRVRLINNAKKEIILSTFAFQSDESGKLILGPLHDAADRGVHIRLLVDGMESWIDIDVYKRQIYEANKAVCKMVCDGFIFNREDHTKKDLYIELIDFDEPEKNVFKIVNQFEIEGINNQLRICLLDTSRCV